MDIRWTRVTGATLVFALASSGYPSLQPTAARVDSGMANLGYRSAAKSNPSSLTPPHPLRVDVRYVASPTRIAAETSSKAVSIGSRDQIPTPEPKSANVAAIVPSDAAPSDIPSQTASEPTEVSGMAAPMADLSRIPIRRGRADTGKQQSEADALLRSLAKADAKLLLTRSVGPQETTAVELQRSDAEQSSTLFGAATHISEIEHSLGPNKIAPTGDRSPAGPSSVINPENQSSVNYLPGRRALPDRPEASVYEAADLADSASRDGEVPRVAGAVGPQTRDGAQRGPKLASKAFIDQISPSPSDVFVTQLSDSAFAASSGYMTVRVADQIVGEVEFRIGQTRAVHIKIGQIVELLEARFDQTEFARLRHSKASETFVSLQQLEEAGLSARYDPVYDEILLEG